MLHASNVSDHQKFRATKWGSQCEFCGAVLGMVQGDRCKKGRNFGFIPLGEGIFSGHTPLCRYYADVRILFAAGFF